MIQGTLNYENHKYFNTLPGETLIALSISGLGKEFQTFSVSYEVKITSVNCYNRILCTLLIYFQDEQNVQKKIFFKTLIHSVLFLVWNGKVGYSLTCQLFAYVVFRVVFFLAQNLFFSPSSGCQFFSCHRCPNKFQQLFYAIYIYFFG